MEPLSSEQRLKLEKYIEKLLTSISFITNAEEDGYFLEAVVRIDALLDLVLGTMLVFSCENDERSKELEIITDAMGPGRLVKSAPRILVKKDMISDALMKRIEKWKKFRNTVVHDLFGTWELLAEKNKFDIKRLEEEERKLLKEECIKGRALLRDLVKEFVKKRTKGEAEFTDLHLGEGT